MRSELSVQSELSSSEQVCKGVIIKVLQSSIRIRLSFFAIRKLLAIVDPSSISRSDNRRRKKKEKEDLLRKIEGDNHVRKNDDNWSASSAGDKSKGKSMQTFRDKMGEDKG